MEDVKLTLSIHIAIEPKLKLLTFYCVLIL